MLISYGPSIINLLIEMGAKPGVVCSKMGLCDAGQQAKVTMTSEKPENDDLKQLVGGNRCTWGPSYWCQSEDHANACGVSTAVAFAFKVFLPV